MVLQEKGRENSSVNLTILTVPHRVVICKIINTLRHAGPLLGKQIKTFSLKRNCMEAVLLFDVLLRRSSDVLHRRWGFRIVGMNCNRTPETRHLRQLQAVCFC
jgi:hypothetical protein